MKARLSKKINVLLGLIILNLTQANCAVNITTSGNGAAGNISITFSSVEFEATQNYSGSRIAIIIDEAFIGDFGPDNGNNLFSGPTIAGGNVTGYLDSGFVINDVSIHDATIIVDGVAPFNSSDILTFAGGTISMTAPNADIDIFSSGSYELFLTDSAGNRISTYGVAVPEPSIFALFAGLSCTGVLVSRKRRHSLD